MLSAPDQIAVSVTTPDFRAETLGTAAHFHDSAPQPPRRSASASASASASMWSPGLNAHRKGGSSICAVLRRDVEHPARGAISEPAAHKPPPLDAEQTWLSNDQDDDLDDIASPGTYRCLVTQWREDGERFSSKTCIRQLDPSFTTPRSLTADLWDSFSPSSDTTLFEDPREFYSDDDIESHDAYFSLDKSDDGHHSISTHTTYSAPPTVVHDGATTPVTRPQLRDRRFATEASPEVNRRHSMPLRTRSKTQTGILELQLGKTEDSASRPTTPRGKGPVTPASERHSRKVSLGLPISIAKPEPPASPAPTRRPPSSKRNSFVPSTPTLSESAEHYSEVELVQQERELEYKHRHTFIGTASLDDFLEILETSPQQTTTKASVAKAFILLANAEHLHARQCSVKPEGWDLVSRITTDSSNSDYVAQAQTKLGSITLKQFMDLMPFDDKQEIRALSVVGAFSAGSHIDAEARAGVGSKAGAFRKWMVKVNHNA